MNRTDHAELPDPFRFEDGTAVRTVDDWPRRRREMRDLIVGIEYGGLPPTPPTTRCDHLHTFEVAALDGARFVSLRVVTGPAPRFSFLMTMLIPAGDGPFPVVLTGDGCWRFVTDQIAAEVVQRGNILAQFNRVELAPDVYNSDRTIGLYEVYPDQTFGALSAWAWGYHRCVDVLSSMDAVDAGRIAVVGHSRGGKAALLAGATDERIALTAPNDSGCGGAGCFRCQGPESETLTDIIRAIPYWFGPDLEQYVGREHELPFDQHYLKALIAPRALLSTEALGDLWANPTGTWQTHLAAREVYRFLNATDRIGIWYRQGDHDHGPADWNALLDFIDWQWHGKATETRFDVNPYPEMQKAFSWAAP